MTQLYAIPPHVTLPRLAPPHLPPPQAKWLAQGLMHAPLSWLRASDGSHDTVPGGKAGKLGMHLHPMSYQFDQWQKVSLMGFHLES